MSPFFTASDNLGAHSYFRTLTEAQAFQAAQGGYIIETTRGRIWRVTLQA
jgi:hypothetical protein